MDIYWQKSSTSLSPNYSPRMYRNRHTQHTPRIPCVRLSIRFIISARRPNIYKTSQNSSSSIASEITTCHIAGAPDIAYYLGACLEHVNTYEMEVADALHALEGEATTETLAERLCQDRGYDHACPLAPRILELDRLFLERAGVIRSGDPAGTWHMP